MNKLTQWLHHLSGLEIELVKKLLSAIIIIVIFWIINRILVKIFKTYHKSPVTQYHWQKGTNYITFSIVIILLGNVWINEFQSIATFIGLLSAGLAIALKDPIMNIAGWMFILGRKPFTIGDRVQIGKHAGDIIDIRIFQFSMIEIGNWVDADQSTGRIIHIPNSKVFSETQANYSLGFNYIWNEIPIIITFESDWEKAKKILQDIANETVAHYGEEARPKIKEASEKHLIFYKQLTPTVYTSVKDSGVLLTIRYLTDVRQRRGSRQKLWEHILKEFAKHKNIDFAYPTQRVEINKE